MPSVKLTRSEEEGLATLVRRGDFQSYSHAIREGLRLLFSKYHLPEFLRADMLIERVQRQGRRRKRTLPNAPPSPEETTDQQQE